MHNSSGEPVTVEKGYSAKYYWVGPVSSSAINSNYYKYAYYFDGKTNFIINPYITIDEIPQFLDNKGPEQIINKIKASFPQITDISVINRKPYKPVDSRARCLNPGSGDAGSNKEVSKFYPEWNQI